MPVIADLFDETPVFSLLESALGKGNLQCQSHGAVKLNFPAGVGTPQRDPQLATAGPPLRTGGHLDGIAQARDFLRGTVEESGYSRDFTAFAVVYLDDVPAPYCGNFTVWPKSHHVMEDVFQKKGHEILLNYMPDVTVPEGPVQVICRDFQGEACRYREERQGCVYGYLAGVGWDPSGNQINGVRKWIWD